MEKDNKIVSMELRKKKGKEVFTPEQDTIKEKVHEQLKKLPGYRGEVITKNNIRTLPGVTVGEIFWVSSERTGYIVSKIDGKKVEIKALDETATVSTGITIYEMNKSIVEKEPVFDLEDETAMNHLISEIHYWFTTTAPATYYCGYGKDLHYVTLFKNSGKYGFDQKSVQNFIDTIAAAGSLISMDFESDRIEIWVRTKDSKAEMIYVFPYDNGLVRLS